MRRIAALAVAAGALAAASVAGAGAPARVTLVVGTSFVDGTTTVVATNIPGCSTSATVSDVSNEFQQVGSNFVFSGVKHVNCGGAGSFDFAYRATSRPQLNGDVGTWTVLGGTGSFAGASGGGNLKGTSSPDGSSITDVWPGVIKFA